MRCRKWLSILFLSILTCALATLPALAPALSAEAPGGAGGVVPAQKPAETPPTAPETIKAEAKLVLLDIIAADKKGNYIRDLEAQDFHVFDDDKEQPITSFFQYLRANPPAGPIQPRYIVLFFDNSTMPPADQIRVRQAASEFVGKTASPDRLFAVVDFTGALRITQNFTAKVDLLNRAMAGTKFASVQPNERGQMTEIASLSSTSPVQIRSDFAARSVLLAIRSLSRTLRTVGGRKTLILFSGGFPLNPERETELTATIDAANKANVAIYSVDVRGLLGLSPSSNPDFTEPGPGFPPGADLRESPFPHESALYAALLAPPVPLQEGPKGGGEGGGRGEGGGGPGGAAGGPGGPGPAGAPGGGPGGPAGAAGPSTGRGENPLPGNRDRGFDPFGNPRGNNPFGNQPGFRNNPNRSIIPPILENVTTNQQVLHALAVGTGGFTIFNTNDFAAGLVKISKDLDEYYVLGYAPPGLIHDGSYHRIRVKVDRKGVALRARTGYYDTKSPDLLAGRPEGKILEERAASAEPGNVPVSLTAPHFYTSANVARVNVTLDIPGSALTFEKSKGKFHSEINVLGIAYRDDGSVGARFSDTVKLDLEKKELKAYSNGSYPYQNSFNIAPGKYNLKVVLSTGGEKFGKYETPVLIEPFDGKKFQLSGLALSDKLVPASQLTSRLDELLLEERTPLLVGGVQVVPSGSNRFTRDEKVGLYVEIYEPLPIKKEGILVGILYDIVDQKTKQQVYSSNTIPVNQFAQDGNPVIPVGVWLPLKDLREGQYRLDVRARDSAGNVTPLRTAEFALQ